MPPNPIDISSSIHFQTSKHLKNKNIWNFSSNHKLLLNLFISPTGKKLITIINIPLHQFINSSSISTNCRSCLHHVINYRESTAKTFASKLLNFKRFAVIFYNFPFPPVFSLLQLLFTIFANHF